MKTLKNYKLIFDDQCPLCQTYSKAFVLTGLLDKEGREGFQEMHEETCTLIDKKRACNEIALVNMETGKVIYGIDSILKIISLRIPLLTKLFKFKPIYYLLKKLYSFISFNRKVIMPSKNPNDTCTPDFNLKYRTLYLILTWLLTSFVLFRYSIDLTNYLPKSTLGREFFICGGQILFQSIILINNDKQKIYNYLGNMMSISLAGAILLVIGILIAKIAIIHSAIFFLIYFFSVVFLMFLEHLRRCKLIGYNLIPSITWILYQLAAFLIIIL
jgi:predicted DCC family thiol-disulfide oxidoreductase YuxK